MRGITKMVMLRTGEKVPKPAYLETCRQLNWLRKYNPVALYELCQLAHNPNHEIFSKYGTQSIGFNLQELGLVSPYNHKIHDMTKAIIIACVVCEGFEARMVNGLL